MFMYIGCLFLIGSYYYRKPIVYNSIYTYVVIENYVNSLRNTYFRNKVNIYNFETSCIIEIFDTNFNYKKYILKDKLTKEFTDNNLDIDFNPKNLFISIILNFNEIETDLTKDINLFVTKNTNINLDRKLAIILNNFLSIGLDENLLESDDNPILWKVIDNNVTTYEGEELYFEIDDSYLLHNLDKTGQLS